MERYVNPVTATYTQYLPQDSHVPLNVAIFSSYVTLTGQAFPWKYDRGISWGGGGGPWSKDASVYMVYEFWKWV